MRCVIQRVKKVAVPPGKAIELFDEFVTYLRPQGFKVEAGEFQANMDVQLVNQGPVTILLGNKKKF